MRFNKFVFDNYLLSSQGKETLTFFNKFYEYFEHFERPDINEYEEENESYIYIIHDFLTNQYLQELNEDQAFDFIINVNKNIDVAKEFIRMERDKIDSIEKAEKCFDSYIKESMELDSITYREFCTRIEYISLVLHYLNPDYFFPYFFLDHFFKLEAIFHEFNIPLPNIPSKVKHKERLYYYFDLCRALYEFRISNKLSPNELNVFLYYFAKNLIDNIDIREEELPEPTKVYISGATKMDCIETIANADKNTRTLWAGNVNTLPGDIIIIYGVAPFSQINSIWRAISKGFFDPFSYWFNLIWVGNPIKINPISYQELVDNKIWGKKGIVKSHMQGVSGVQCSVEEYNEIVNIQKIKKFKIDILPIIKGPQLHIGNELNTEQDVEVYLLEPLLKKLGFSKQDWIRQMSLRMGRGERIYPDYAIKANTKKGEETAEFIWEAKYRISNQRQISEAFF